MKKTDNKISIIVPIYNAEKYLARCIESILRQTYRNLELVLVNDCTPDNSMKIAGSYAEKDNRVKIVENKKNLGPMRARDNGRLTAVGDWYMFVDADDWLPATAAEKLLLQALTQHAEIVSGTMQGMNEMGEVVFEIRSELPFGTDTDGIIKALFDNSLNHNLANKIFNKHLFEAPLLVYDYNTNAEDALIFYQLVDRIKTMATLNDVVYFYRQGTSVSARGASMTEKQIANIALFLTYLNTHFVSRHLDYRGDVEKRTFNQIIKYLKHGIEWDILNDNIHVTPDLKHTYTRKYIFEHSTICNKIVNLFLLKSQAYRRLYFRLYLICNKIRQI